MYQIFFLEFCESRKYDRKSEDLVKRTERTRPHIMLFKLSLYLGEFKQTFWYLIFKTVGKIQEIKKSTRNEIGMILCVHIKTDMTFAIFIQCPVPAILMLKMLSWGSKVGASIFIILVSCKIYNSSKIQ